jgi:hypothetical protein
VIAINVVSDCANEGRALARGPDAAGASRIGQGGDQSIDVPTAGVRGREGDFGGQLAKAERGADKGSTEGYSTQPH